MTKTCVKCGIEKDLEFFAKGNKYIDGRRGTCKQCHSDYVSNYYKVNPDKYETKKQVKREQFKRHRLSTPKYVELFTMYYGQCHACKSALAINIDHDHSCCSGTFSCGNCVRGLLCSQCNTALGLLKDDVTRIKNLLDYIS
jgi:hypothetical protein